MKHCYEKGKKRRKPLSLSHFKWQLLSTLATLFSRSIFELVVKFFFLVNVALVLTSQIGLNCVTFRSQGDCSIICHSIWSGETGWFFSSFCHPLTIVGSHCLCHRLGFFCFWASLFKEASRSQRAFDQYIRGSSVTCPAFYSVASLLVAWVELASPSPLSVMVVSLFLSGARLESKGGTGFVAPKVF